MSMFHLSVFLHLHHIRDKTIQKSKFQKSIVSTSVGFYSKAVRITPTCIHKTMISFVFLCNSPPCSLAQLVPRFQKRLETRSEKNKYRITAAISAVLPDGPQTSTLVKWALASWHVKHKATETKTETLRKFLAIACPGTTRGHRVMFQRDACMECSRVPTFVCGVLCLLTFLSF